MYEENLLRNIKDNIIKELNFSIIRDYLNKLPSLPLKLSLIIVKPLSEQKFYYMEIMKATIAFMAYVLLIDSLMDDLWKTTIRKSASRFIRYSQILLFYAYGKLIDLSLYINNIKEYLKELRNFSLSYANLLIKETLSNNINNYLEYCEMIGKVYSYSVSLPLRIFMFNQYTYCTNSTLVDEILSFSKNFYTFLKILDDLSDYNEDYVAQTPNMLMFVKSKYELNNLCKAISSISHSILNSYSSIVCRDHCTNIIDKYSLTNIYVEFINYLQEKIKRLNSRYIPRKLIKCIECSLNELRNQQC